MNKELRGNFTPTEFNLIAKQVQEEIFRGYFEDEARDKYKEKRGLVGQGYSNLSFNQRQRIDEFSAQATLAYSTPNFTLPSDLYLIKDFGIDYLGTVVEEMEGQKVAFLGKSLAAPSTTFPTYEPKSGFITIAPRTTVTAGAFVIGTIYEIATAGTTDFTLIGAADSNPGTIFTATGIGTGTGTAVTGIFSGVTARYVRVPADPKWTYTIVSNAELYNPGAGDFQDFELHTSEFSNIVIRMLSYFGINIREKELTQYAEAMKQKQDVKEES